MRAVALSALVGCVVFFLPCLGSAQLTNWAGNIQYDEKLFVEPSSIEEVVELVKVNQRVSIVGTRHSFNNISQTSDGIILSTRRLNRIVSCCDNMQVTVEAGVTYAKLGAYLATRGFAIHNYASLPHLSVGGAISTATHGSGITNGNLATAVTALKLVTATGDIVQITRRDDAFAHAVVALGAGGVIVEVSLELHPPFDVQQCIYRDVSLHKLKPVLENILSTTYSVSLFTQWQDGDLISSVWCKHKVAVGAPPFECEELAGARASREAVHPLPDTRDAEACSGPGVGPSHVQLPHFVATHTPSHGDELQTELFVPRARWEEALAALFDLEARTGELRALLLVSELRFIAADALTLSPQRVLGDALGIHFTWKPHAAGVMRLLPKLLDLLSPLHPLPHWGKLFLPEAFDLRRYGSRFTEYLDRVDPHRKFSSAFVDSCLSSGQLDSTQGRQPAAEAARDEL